MHQQTILYATDLSPQSLESFQLACRIATAWKAKLLIAHVEEPPPQTEFSGYLNEYDLGRELRKIVPYNVQVDYEHILRQGDPADVIRELEKEYNVDLIVLGTHGRKGLERMVIGSVAEKIMRRANCPVLTYRQTGLERMLSRVDRKAKILVPTDFSVHSYAALDFASSIAAAIFAELTILHVGEPVKSTAHDPTELSLHRQTLREQLRHVLPNKQAVTCHHKLLIGSPAKEITSFANENHFEIIVLGTHGRRGVGRAFLGSVAEMVARNANCAVITVKPSNKRHSVLNYQ